MNKYNDPISDEQSDDPTPESANPSATATTLFTPRMKIAVALVLFVGALGYFIFTTFDNATVYYLSVSEIEAGGPEAIAPLAVYLLSDAARDTTAQIYTCTGKRIAVWNQPEELRHMSADDGEMFTVDEIAERLPTAIGAEEMPMFADLERRMKEMAERKAASEAGTAS